LSCSLRSNIERGRLEQVISESGRRVEETVAYKEAGISYTFAVNEGTLLFNDNTAFCEFTGKFYERDLQVTDGM
jgi:hypothetical protein